MKKILFLSSLLVTLLAFACKNTGTDTTSTMVDSTSMSAAGGTVDSLTAPMDSTTMAFACSMHPEVTGKDGDKCSKCGMALVSIKKAEPGHEGHNH